MILDYPRRPKSSTLPPNSTLVFMIRTNEKESWSCLAKLEPGLVLTLDTSGTPVIVDVKDLAKLTKKP